MGCLVTSVTGCGQQTSSSTSIQGTPSTQQGTTTPAVTSMPAVSAGEADYTQNCATCHESPPPTKNPQQVIKVVNSGKGRMPGFKGKLSDSQIQAIANYVISGK